VGGRVRLPAVRHRKASTKLAELVRVPLPDTPVQRLELVTELCEIATKRMRLAQEEGWLQSVLSEHWQGERTAFSDTKAVIIWIVEAGFQNAFKTSDDLLTALNKVQELQQISLGLSVQLTESRQSISACFARLGLTRADWTEGAVSENTPFAVLLRDLDELEDYHSACKTLERFTHLPLPAEAAGSVRLADELKAVQGLRHQFSGKEDLLHSCLCECWIGDETRFDAPAASMMWLRHVKKSGIIFCRNGAPSYRVHSRSICVSTPLTTFRP
jgi:hypothetical protein